MLSDARKWVQITEATILEGRHLPTAEAKRHTLAYVVRNAEGWRVPHIAQRLDRNAHTMRTWLKASQAAGLQGLSNTPQPGRPATKGQSVTAHLERLLAQSPSHCGSSEDGWTIALIRHYLAQHTGDGSDATGRRQWQAGG
jgi:transposase